MREASPLFAERARLGLDRRGGFGVPAPAAAEAPSSVNSRLTTNTVSTHQVLRHPGPVPHYTSYSLTLRSTHVRINHMSEAYRAYGVA